VKSPIDPITIDPITSNNGTSKQHLATCTNESAMARYWAGAARRDHEWSEAVSMLRNGATTHPTKHPQVLQVFSARKVLQKGATIKHVL